MATTTGFKDIIDLPEWRPIANSLGSNGNPYNMNLASDPRNSEDRHPIIFRQLGSSIERYNIKNDEWSLSDGIGGSSISGGIVVYPAQGPRGVLAAGNTTTKLVISTALPASVGVNALANRGDGRGFKVRVVDNAAGASGKVEERVIVGNTGGTTPTIYLDSALTFTPTTGSAYEFLSGKLYLLTSGGTDFRSYDILTQALTSLSTGGLTSSTNGSFTNLDELLVPYDRNPGEGFFGNLVATASAAGTLTGQAVAGDSAVLTNEYRNFQIRVVQDTAIPTAVGQRRQISSHTAGASPVYTLASVWTVTPSATATYVIEQFGDRIIWWAQSASATFTYNITADTWDTVTFAARPTSPASGAPSSYPSYGLSVSDLGVGKEARHSFIFSPKSNATSSIDLFDIAGGATGLWTSTIVYGGLTSNQLFQTGFPAVYDPSTNQGRYSYISLAGQRHARFDSRNRVMETWAWRPYPDLGGTLGNPNQVNSSNGQRLALALFIDGSTKLMFIVEARAAVGGIAATNLCGEMFQILAQR